MVTSFATCLYRMGDDRRLPALVPPYLQQPLEYRLLERSGMNATETVDGRWISPPFEKKESGPLSDSSAV